jgi:hypothetical protein
MPDPSISDREEIRRKIWQMRVWHITLRVVCGVLIVVTLIFFARQDYLLAIPMGLLAVLAGIGSDWVVKPPNEV